MAEIMAEPALARMTADEFLRWDYEREGKHELVDGFVLRMMVGARDKHDGITVNVLSELRQRLRGGDCRPRTDDLAVRTTTNGVRRPDVTVDCGPRDPNALEALDPRVVFEVLSPSTRVTDATVKLDEYKSVDGLAHIVIIDPDVVDVVAWSRAGGSEGWTMARFTDLDDALPLAGIGTELPLATIYEDADPAPAPPRLVE